MKSQYGLDYYYAYDLPEPGSKFTQRKLQPKVDDVGYFCDVVTNLVRPLSTKLPDWRIFRSGRFFKGYGGQNTPRRRDISHIRSRACRSFRPLELLLYRFTHVADFPYRIPAVTLPDDRAILAGLKSLPNPLSVWSPLIPRSQHISLVNSSTLVTYTPIPSDMQSTILTIVSWASAVLGLPVKARCAGDIACIYMDVAPQYLRLYVIPRNAG